MQNSIDEKQPVSEETTLSLNTAYGFLPKK